MPFYDPKTTEGHSVLQKVMVLKSQAKEVREERVVLTLYALLASRPISS